MSGVDLTLLRPLWLLGLPALVLFGWWLFARRGGLGDWPKASDPALLRAMAALGRVDKGASRAPLLALLGALGLILVGLAGPAIERRDTLSFRNLDAAIFVVDASASVTEDARWPQMLTMGRFGLAALGTRPGALIVYAGDAYVAMDLTLDHLQLGQTLSLIGPETVPDPGSRPERGLRMAVDLLAEAEVLAGDVVLLSDGAGLGTASLRAAGAIAARGARLSLIALETPTAAFETHAAAGQGRVFTLDETDALADWVSAKARTRLERQDYPLLFWQDLGRYLLLLALIPMLLLFRKARP
ncbi:VWA domain-containing protein [Roseobacter sinensis]|uniref:VWA domain-containing protein n=1 Tax=Roseobacter sinensis TaxID=2931391 RepID=A0ABT3BKH0_9RHOB|nr:VWA domain-containing protein [Roseobacter sp. WL0113]MCV3274056.1 VWA domain-containing protein [Roseobacter sp. WL0113]